ncbi:hypothetical protein ACLB2K_066576 [Fragaria x ananassa]
MGFTENNYATFLSSGNPCLDFFFHVVPDTSSSYLHQQLPLAWAHDALTTLKLICNLRGVRDTGKSDKESFYTDLPEILYRLLQGQDVRKNQKFEWEQRKHSIARRPSPRWTKSVRTGLGVNRQEPKEVRRAKATKRVKSESESTSALRHQKTIEMAKKAIERYQQDSDYRFLYDRISELFAECLKSDVENLNPKDYKKISLAAKWCPSTDSSFNRATLLCESIARTIFLRESNPEYERIEEAHYDFIIWDWLRKEIMVPLRKDAPMLLSFIIAAFYSSAISHNLHTN